VGCAAGRRGVCVCVCAWGELDAPNISPGWAPQPYGPPECQLAAPRPDRMGASCTRQLARNLPLPRNRTNRSRTLTSAATLETTAC
jgi:hypothetical protein